MNIPETINIEKYIEALDDLLGSDNAYYAGDPDVDAIMEVIVAAKKLENKVKELTEENEKLKAEIKDLEADYERVYEQAEADIHGNIADGGTSCHWCMDKTRGDTVRKMQDKLKAELDERYSLYFRILGGELIDRIAEELLEEKKDVEE